MNETKINHEYKILIFSIFFTIAFIYLGNMYNFTIPIALLLVILFSLIYLKNRKKSQNIVVFLLSILPIYFGVRVSNFLPLITVFRIVYFIFIIDEIFIKNKINKLIIEIKKEKLTKLIIALIIAYNLSIIINFEAKSIMNLCAICLEDILFYYIIKINLDNAESLNKILKTIALSTLILGILGIFEYLFSFNIFNLLNITNDSRLLQGDIYIRMNSIRVMTSFGQPLAYNLYLAITIPIVIYAIKLYKIEKNLKLEILYKFDLIILLINLVLTGSRSAIIILCIQMFIIFMFKNYKQKINLIISFLLISIIAITISLSTENILLDGIKKYAYSVSDAVLGTELTQDFGTNENAFLYRKILIENAMKLRGKKLLFGSGPEYMRENPITVYSWKVNEWDSKWELKSIDNYYLVILFNYGIIVLIVIIILFVTFLKQSYRYIRRDQLSLYLFVSLIGYMLYLLIVDELETMKYLWIVFAIVSSNIKLINSGSGKEIKYAKRGSLNE